MRTWMVCGITAALLFAGACRSRGLDSKDAVQTAIVKHLQLRPNVILNNMTLNVEDVKFEGERATAAVKFSSKDRPDLAVGVRYVLRRAGDHWEVESSSPMGGMGTTPHGAAGAPPAPEPATTTPQPSH